MAHITLKADINECTVENWQSNAGEVNARVMSVEMSDDLLTCDKQFVTFDLADGTKYESLVVDGKAKIPIFEESQFVKIGLYAENVDGNECEKRYSAHPDNVYVSVGSFGNADKQPKPTPGDYAELLKEIEDIKNSGGGDSGDGCGITVVDDLDLEKEYGAKEVPSMNNFADKLSILSEISASLADVEKLKAKDVELSDKINKNKTDITQYVISELSRKQNNLVDTASVGQTVRVKDVDANGKPTNWEPVDFPVGGSEEWEHICELSVNGDDALREINQTFDVGYKKILVVFPSSGKSIATAGRVLIHSKGKLLGAIIQGVGDWKQVQFCCEVVGKYITGYVGASISNLNLPTDNEVNFTSISNIQIYCESGSATFNTKKIDIYGVRA